MTRIISSEHNKASMYKYGWNVADANRWCLSLAAALIGAVCVTSSRPDSIDAFDLGVQASTMTQMALPEDPPMSEQDENLLGSLKVDAAKVSAGDLDHILDAMHLLDVFFNITARHDPVGKITETELEQFINISLNVKANEYPDKTCLDNKLPIGCQRFTLNRAGIHKMFTRDLYRQHVTGCRMSVFQFKKMILRQGQLNANVRRMLFLLINPSWRYKLSNISTWEPVNATQWDAFLTTHKVKPERSVVYRAMFEKITSNDNNLLRIRLFEAAINTTVHAL